jgi:hypothetical protein
LSRNDLEGNAWSAFLACVALILQDAGCHNDLRIPPAKGQQGFLSMVVPFGIPHQFQQASSEHMQQTPLEDIMKRSHVG